MKQKNYIFGIRALIEAVKSGKNIDKVLIKSGLRGELFLELRALLKQLDVPVQYVPIEKINRITQKNHQGVLAFLSPISYQNIEQILPMIYEQGKTPLVLVLDGITDVRNMGAIARTAECAGVHALVVATKNSAQINADAIKTSAGALNHIPVCRVDSLKETLSFLQQSGLQVVAANEKASSFYYQTDFSLPTALVLGAEDKGISPAIIRQADHLVKIPQTGTVASLNVSVAAGILIYETVRQRTP